MKKISVFKQSRYPVSAKKVKERVKKTLSENGIVSDYEVEVAIVGQKKIDELAGESKHPVLAYANNEIKEPFVFPKKDVVYLGEIVVSYPAALTAAKKEGKLIDESVADLAEHATLHLLGIHHD